MGNNVSNYIRSREGVFVMMSFSPDGSTKYTPYHSYQNKSSWYYYGTTPTYGNLSNTWHPVLHLGKNSINNVDECVMPSSLVYHVRSKYPSAQYLPTTPLFQIAKTTCVKPSDSSYPMQGFATFIPGATDPFDTGINGYSSHILTGCHTDVDGTSYIYVQPTGYTGTSSVLINQSGSILNSAYYVNSRSNYINQYEYPTDSITSFDRITKVILHTTEQNPNLRWYHVAVNFLISIQALNYDLWLALLNARANYGVQIPFYCSVFNEQTGNPSWSFTWDDVYANDSSYWNYISNPGVFRLNPGRSMMGFARAFRLGGGGTWGQGDYFLQAYQKDNTDYCWVSGSVNFEVEFGFTGGCPRGYSSLSFGSPIMVFKNSDDYILDSTQTRSQLLMSCAETIEIWAV